ncbi:MAG: alcohol dehydrogenase catalytic domain-containing protein [Chloroflexi bacterium]|nr:alcohol dehydrogenase catalytic domain-containing protein [Chloroflexota bacterium]MBV9892722.1 alcohol dehydrogenase catalytic domain-containing protein [Chloroflexota bacterium]
MTERVLAAVQVAPETTELREFPQPEVASDAALLKVEAAGVCGSDVGGYKRMGAAPRILGHENVGVIARAGEAFARRWGVKEGDRVAIEEYLPCGHCDLCLRGEFRHCAGTDVHSNPDALRYGNTPITTAPALWGGYSQYLYMPPATVLHRVPEHVPGEQAAMALPIGNGIQWAVVEAQAGPGRTLLVMGPGQQGLACVLAAKAAGADMVILTGLSHDTHRLDVGRKLGADITIVADHDDVRERIREVTGGKGVDAAVDTTSAPSSEMIPLMIDVVKRKEGRIVVQSIGGTIADFPIEKLARKYITLKAARGHSYASVELAIQRIASGHYPLELLATHCFGLDGVDTAIRSVGGTGAAGAIHVTVTPWLPSSA